MAADEQQMHDETDSGQHAAPDGPGDVVSARMFDHGGYRGCDTKMGEGISLISLWPPKNLMLHFTMI